jgi:uncharacterized protein YprB with RNaseH-like and TPR domain
LDKPRILFYDIETTDLQGDFGNMLAFGYKWLGDKEAEVISLLDTNNLCHECQHVDAVSDKRLVQEASYILNAADMWVTWYGKGFDAKFLNTRVLDANLPPLSPIPHVDLYFTAKCHLKLSSNRLANVQDFLNLPTTKTPLTKRVWRQAQAGHVPSIEYIIDHCEKDVLVLEEAYERLKPYVRQHPYLGKRGTCRVCNSSRLQRRGRVNSRTGTFVRVMCKDCGHWGQRTA